VCLVSSPYHGHLRSSALRSRSMFVGVVVYVLARFTVLTILPPAVAYLSVCGLRAGDIVSLRAVYALNPTRQRPYPVIVMDVPLSYDDKTITHWTYPWRIVSNYAPAPSEPNGRRYLYTSMIIESMPHGQPSLHEGVVGEPGSPEAESQ